MATDDPRLILLEAGRVRPNPSPLGFSTVDVAIELTLARLASG